ncbi:hypothetical protein T459_28804 [Capsicum annuum]|uniref:FF domain-containing protein n=1 Tax=Capsicum annuum TaxID=4072 RepID=A0A2G2YHV4_CAPAN|nr:hypothetical protein T459_28804 [Capsicum annuum]
MMVDDLLVVVGDAVSYDGGMVVSTDTIASVVDGGGRGGDADESGGDGVRRMCGELSSLSGKVSSLMIKIFEIKNSLEPASLTVANSEKIGIAVTLGNLRHRSKTATTQDTVVYGDGFSSENRENVKKDSIITEIRGGTPSNKKTIELGPLVYERKEEAKSAFKTLLKSANIGKAISILEHDERFKAIERAKSREDLFEDYVEELEKKEHAKALEEQKRNRVEYLEFLKSCEFIKASSQWRKVLDRLETDERCSRLDKIDRLDIFQEYLCDLESEEEEQRKLRMFVFEELLERAREKEEKEASKRKRLADEFYELLHASKCCVLHVNKYCMMMISSTPALCLECQQIYSNDDILNASIVSCVSTDILNADDILDANVVSAHQEILNDDDIFDASVVSCVSTDILNDDDMLNASVVSSASIDIE